MTIEENKNNVYQAVKEACEKANRSSNEVNIIAVTKYVSCLGTYWQYSHALGSRQSKAHDLW